MSAPSPLHLAAALDGAGWHPAAWREPASRPRELFTARHWADLVAEAEHGLLDFVTFEDALAPQSSRPDGPDGRTDRVHGRLDAVLTAARVAPLTRHIGLVPTVTATHTEPFHLSKAVATLDHVSNGRAGVRIRVTARPDEAAHFGRRTFPAPGTSDPTDSPAAVAEELWEEAADYVEVLRRLWDSWEDDAEIRDAATGRFVDRDKLHHIDFEGRFFRVRGPSITPRPPQGLPPVAVPLDGPASLRTAARSADLVHVPADDADRVRDAVARLRGLRDADGPLHVLGDLAVLLDESAAAAADRRARLDDLDGPPVADGIPVFAGTPAGLADLLLDLRAAGLTGFRLHPAVLGHDLPAVTRGLVPELQSRGAFRTAYGAGTLRGLLGLPRPANRYAAAAARS
ncbi:LLM class flavin-dependent oxidoreductase [Streptomyces sp. NPDC001380]|uniref:LLM class flavin-dependent oxidoreductase n=1 Tax=Streptomyces sp. NPDC001380 TaxID=3364566 RepID=UPI003693A4F2